MQTILSALQSKMHEYGQIQHNVPHFATLFLAFLAYSYVKIAKKENTPWSLMSFHLIFVGYEKVGSKEVGFPRCSHRILGNIKSR
ncbi:MAG: hypothetical protein IJ786_01845 [Bacteroidaceae bacterium]|nr:hypothetical protein [Bacteroidaceae bacterium]